MTPDDAYNIGFLAGCAEAGLDGQAAVALRQKTADLWSSALDASRAGLFSALATGTVVGGGIGAGLGVMARPDPLKNDNAPLVRNLQQAELIAALRQHATRARQTATVLRAKAETPAPRSVFGI